MKFFLLTCFNSGKNLLCSLFYHSSFQGARDFHSPAAVAARKFHKFERIIHGRIISKPPHNTPLPDLSRMHKWTPHEYDLYDLSLMNKWRISGWDENEATYAVSCVLLFSFVFQLFIFHFLFCLHFFNLSRVLETGQLASL